MAEHEHPAAGTNRLDQPAVFLDRAQVMAATGGDGRASTPGDRTVTAPRPTRRDDPVPEYHQEREPAMQIRSPQVPPTPRIPVNAEPVRADQPHPDVEGLNQDTAAVVAAGAVAHRRGFRVERAANLEVARSTVGYVSEYGLPQTPAQVWALTQSVAEQTGQPDAERPDGAAVAALESVCSTISASPDSTTSQYRLESCRSAMAGFDTSHYHEVLTVKGVMEPWAPAVPTGTGGAAQRLRDMVAKQDPSRTDGPDRGLSL